jgi:hypothetical protein
MMAYGDGVCNKGIMVVLQWCYSSVTLVGVVMMACGDALVSIKGL